MSNMQIQNVLAEMRALSARAGGSVEVTPKTQGPSFSEVLTRSVNEVNAAQHDASQLAAKFEQGVPGVGLADVMVSMQKASLQFEAVTQVRNKLVSAYREIMNMQA